MGDAHNDAFGDRRLVNIELMPTAAHQRILGWRQLAPLWAVVGLSPGIYELACGRLPVLPALVALAAALGLTALFGALLSRSAGRFGIGYAPLCRAAFGARGALVPILLRWLIGVVWLGLWASQIGQAVVALVSTLGSAPAFLRTPLGQDLAGWGIAAALVVGAWLVARGGMSRVVRVAIVSVLTVALVGFGLVVFAGIESKGFGSWFGRAPGWTAPDLFGAIARAVGLTLPALLVCSDWGRFRRGRNGRTPAHERSALDIVAPAAVIPVGVAVAFAGALLASASHALGAGAAGAPIADAARFGGWPGGLVAAVLVTGMWLGAAPLVGVYSTSLAACAVVPRRIGYHVGLGITGVGALAVVPLARASSAWGVESTSMLWVLAAPFGVLFADEIVVRRGRLLLEELYLFSRHYGPVGDVTLSALLALVLGWLLHPEVTARLLAWLPASAAEIAAAVARVQPDVRAFAGSALVAGLAYALFAPLERLAFGRRRAGAEARKGARERPLEVMEQAETAGLTDPHFVANQPRRRMQTIENDSYQLGSTDLELLDATEDAQLVTAEDPLAPSGQHPGSTRDRAREVTDRGPKGKSSEEQRVEDDWAEPDD